ncbi:MAG: hypothetical protein V3W22_02880, partial [Thermoplasmata archaeon]
DHGSGPLSSFVNVVPRLQEIKAFRLRRSPLRSLSRNLRTTVEKTPIGLRARGSRLLPPKLRDALLDHLGPMQDWIPSARRQFQDRVDWSSSVIPLSQGLIYGNPGRSRHPISLSTVSQALEGLRGVVRVWRREEIFSGPHLSAAPALWIETEPGVEIVARFDAEWEYKRPERGKEWIVNHRQEGIFGFLGKDVVSSEITKASIYDMCPTILSFFGIPPPPQTDGTVLPLTSGSPGPGDT